MLGVELPEPGAIEPFHPAYVDVRPAWAMLLMLAYLPAFKYAVDGDPLTAIQFTLKPACTLTPWS